MTVRHHVAASDPHAHLVTVTSTFLAAPEPTPEPEREAGALPDPLVVFMPVWTPGSYLAREYARHVEVPRATTRDGTPLAVRKIRKNAWSIAHGGASEVSFAYELYCNDLTVRTNHLDATHLYLNGAATFCTSEHAPDEAAEVRLEVPSTFRVVTPLAERDGAFHAASFDELVDSPISAGLQHIRDVLVLGKRHRFAIWGDAANVGWDEVMRDTKLLVETEAKLFGGELPYQDYTLIWLLTPRARGGLEHCSSVTLTVPPQLFDDRKGYLDVLSLVAHEIFHAWNVKRIRPAGLTPYRYQEENYTRLLWWFEGATSYYDWRMLRTSGLATVDEYLEHLGDEIARLEDIPGRARQSVSEASFDAWIKLYRSDENTVNSTVSYYLKGEIVCALLDVDIRTRSAGTRSLDDVLRELWGSYGALGIPVPEDAMPEIFERATGISMRDVLDAWVEGRGELPIDAVFGAIGLAVRRERAPERKAKVSLGVRMRSTEGRAIVSSVLRHRAAHKAGIDAGDEIVAIGGKRLEGSRVESALAGRAPGSVVEIAYARDGQLRTASVTLEVPAVERVRLSVAETATSAQKSLLEGWLSGMPGTTKER